MVFGYPVSFSADRYLSDGETLALGNLELRFFHTPGHTPGGLCILAGDTLFSGDTLFAQSIGRTDFPQSSYAELIRSVKEKLFALPDDTKVLPGHMGPTTIGFEKENNPFV
jgi:glyoxylase-like metal-dependent hydrolase (beta-lactamase superfamily II)